MTLVSELVSPRRERAAVRLLAEEIDAARLALGGRLPPGDDLDARSREVLTRLWSERFSRVRALTPGALSAALKRLGVDARAADLPTLTTLLSREPTMRLASRLAQAHELTIDREVCRRGRKVVLARSGLRRRQGVYYTPRDVVHYIVSQTLGGQLPPWERALRRASPGRCFEILEEAKTLRVLDPACGGGAFLLGALERLRAFYALVAARLGDTAPPELSAPGRMALANNLFAVDLDAGALALAELALLAAVQGEPGATPTLIGGALQSGDHLEMAHARLFPCVFERPGPGFDVVLGNPPYAAMCDAQRDTARRSGLRTAEAKDIYMTFVEGMTRLVRARGRGGLIVPLSLVFSRMARTLREEVMLTSDRHWRLASFDRIPSGLFEANVRTRTTIALMLPRRPADKPPLRCALPRNADIASGARALMELAGQPPGKPADKPPLRCALPGSATARVSTTRLVRFSAANRSRVFETLEFFDTRGLCRLDLGFPKLGSALQAEWLERLDANAGRLGDGVQARGAHRLHYKQNCYAFAIVTARLPPAFGEGDVPVAQTKYGSLGFAHRDERDAALAVCAGRWLFWWWLVYGDGFDMTGKLISALPIDPRRLSVGARKSLATLGRQIQARVQRHVAYKKNGGKRIGTYDLRTCRTLTDRADALVARELGAEALLADIRGFLARTHGAG